MDEIKVFVKLTGLIVESVKVRGYSADNVTVVIIDDTIHESWDFDDEDEEKVAYALYEDEEKEMDSEDSFECRWYLAGYEA